VENKNLLQKIEATRQNLLIEIKEKENFLIEARGKLKFIDDLLIEDPKREKPIKVISISSKGPISSVSSTKREISNEVALIVKEVLKDNKEPMSVQEILLSIEKLNLWPETSSNKKHKDTIIRKIAKSDSEIEQAGTKQRIVNGCKTKPFYTYRLKK
jgi:hypothetical protein